MITKSTIAILFVFFFIACGRERSNDMPSQGHSVQELANNWQLFIDDYWILDSTNLKATLHQPVKHPDNPILRGDAPWEQNPYCYGTVIYDKESSHFKIWYMSYNYEQPVADRTPVLYATSTNGISWQKSDLGLISYQGSTNNNIILTNYGHHDLYAPSVIKDRTDPDPNRRYKMIWWDFPLGDVGYQDDGMCVAFSADGIEWNKYSGNPVLHAKKQAQSISDVMSVMQDERTGKYVAYTKGWAEPWPAFRQIVRTESDDFIHWSQPEVVIRHRHDEQDPQSYGMTVSQMGNIYLGLLHSYKHPGDETIDVQLVVSHDNHHWKRVAEEATFIPNGPSESWDAGMIFTAPLIEYGGQMLFYYGGFVGAHNLEYGSNRAGIGLATLRKDGFVSLDAGTKSGSVTTHSMRNINGPLYVNADASGGSLYAELLDVAGRIIPGYTATDCLAISANGNTQEVRWKNQAALPESVKVVKIRFILSNASLYGFYAGPDVARIDEG